MCLSTTKQNHLWAGSRCERKFEKHTIITKTGLFFSPLSDKIANHRPVQLDKPRRQCHDISGWGGEILPASHSVAGEQQVDQKQRQDGQPLHQYSSNDSHSTGRSDNMISCQSLYRFLNSCLISKEMVVSAVLLFSIFSKRRWRAKSTTALRCHAECGSHCILTDWMLRSCL